MRVLVPSIALALLGSIPTHADQPTPPVAHAGIEDLTECTSYFSTLVQLDGSASRGEITSYEWFLWYGTELEYPLGRGMRTQACLPFGRHFVTLKVTDTAGQFSLAYVQKQVFDSTAPVVRVTTTPSVLWPPDQRMVDVVVSPVVEEACDGVSVQLLSVTSNEPDDGDIQEVTVGTDDRSFRLRAETGTVFGGRRYLVTYAVTDAVGLQSTGNVAVTVEAPRKITRPSE